MVATDASEKQIAEAQREARIEYRVAFAESSGLAPASVNLVIIAQALHWFDLPRFYSEVDRVLAPEGVIAAWSYQLASVNPAVDRVIHHLYRDVVGSYWPPERSLVERGYGGVPFPYSEIPAPSFAMEEEWDLGRLLGYLGTWSAVQRCRQQTGSDPIGAVRPELEQAWGDPAAPRTVRWPLRLRVGRKTAVSSGPAVL